MHVKSSACKKHLQGKCCNKQQLLSAAFINWRHSRGAVKHNQEINNLHRATLNYSLNSVTRKSISVFFIYLRSKRLAWDLWFMALGLKEFMEKNIYLVLIVMDVNLLWWTPMDDAFKNGCAEDNLKGSGNYQKNEGQETRKQDEEWQCIIRNQAEARIGYTNQRTQDDTRETSWINPGRRHHQD